MENNRTESPDITRPEANEVRVEQVGYTPDYTAKHGLEGHLNRIRAELAQSQEQSGVEL